MQKNGFTLIELLVVVIIIAILAAIALPQYFNAVEKSRTAEAKTVLVTLKYAQDRYYLTHGAYTTNIEDLDVTAPESMYWTYTVGTLSSVATRKASPNYLLGYRYSGKLGTTGKPYSNIICRSDTDTAYGDKICQMLGATEKDIDGKSWVLPF